MWKPFHRGDEGAERTTAEAVRPESSGFRIRNADQIRQPQKTGENTEKVFESRETDRKSLQEEKKAADRVSIPSHRTEEIRKAEALQEIDMKDFSRKELDRTAEDNKNRFFRNGKNEYISYADAQKEMMDSISGSLDKLAEKGRPMGDEQKDAILRDVNETLLKQQAESQSRAIGNHGIPHLYGVYERMRNTPEDVLELGAEQMKEKDPSSRATAEDLRLGMALAAVYHDEGYLSDQAQRGVNNEGDDSLHGIDSAIAFENRHRELYDGVVDKRVLDEVTQAMAEHNLLSPKNANKLNSAETPQPHRMEMMSRIDVEKNSELDPNEGLIRSALLLSDKAALDADEKIPDVLRQKESLEIMTRYWSQKGTMSEAETKAASVRMQEDMKKAILKDQHMTETEKKRMTEAVDKDVSISSGSFNMPLSGAAITHDALQFRTEINKQGQREIEAELTIQHRLNDEIYLDSFNLGKESETEGPQPEAKKITGAMKDLGIIPKGKELSETDFSQALERMDEDHMLVRTEGVQGLDHVSVRLREIQPDMIKSEISESERIEENTIQEMLEKEEEKWEQAREAGEQRRFEEDFLSRQRAGSVTKEDILSCCSYFVETESDEVRRISDETDALVRVTDESERQEKLQALGKRCEEMIDRERNRKASAENEGEEASV